MIGTHSFLKTSIVRAQSALPNFAIGTVEATRADARFSARELYVRVCLHANGKAWDGRLRG